MLYGHGSGSDSYVGYVDYGERRFASKEELEQISQFGAAADSLVQEMLLGKISPKTVQPSWAPSTAGHRTVNG